VFPEVGGGGVYQSTDTLVQWSGGHKVGMQPRVAERQETCVMQDELELDWMGRERLSWAAYQSIVPSL